jgi:hypothetical protein
LNKTKEISCVILVTVTQMSEVAKPGEKTFNLPSSLVTSQRTSILPVAFNPILPIRGYHLYPLFLKLLVQTIAVISLVSYKVFRLISSKSGLKSSFNKGDFMRRSALLVYGDRKTSTVCNCHDFRTLSPFGLTNTESPFLAAMKVPSIKHSLRSSLPRFFMSSASALRIFSKAPHLTHSWKRRWQVWYGGYLSGKSCQGAPVRRTHKTPLNISLGSRLGLPLPCFLGGGSGNIGLSIIHCSLVTSTTPPDNLKLHYV